MRVPRRWLATWSDRDDCGVSALVRVALGRFRVDRGRLRSGGGAGWFGVLTGYRIEPGSARERVRTLA